MIYTAEGAFLAIGNWAVEHDILILADDIYGRLAVAHNGNILRQFLVYRKLSASKQWLSMAFLKSYSMTGWRIGFRAVGEPEIIAAAMSKVAKRLPIQRQLLNM